MHDPDDRWQRSWQRLEEMARSSFRNLNDFGRDFSGWGGNFRIGRMLASGDVRLVALYLIEQQPRHGYDLIKAMEERSQGFYSPSPGVVYPALTFLEEAGYVTSSSDGNKRLYTITDSGREHLNDNREAIQSTLDFLGKAGAQMQEWRERMASANFNFGDGERAEGEGHWSGPQEARTGGAPSGAGAAKQEAADRDMADVAPELNDARKALKRAIKSAIRHDAQLDVRVAEILRRAADDIRALEADAEDDIDLG